MNTSGVTLGTNPPAKFAPGLGFSLRSSTSVRLISSIE